MSADNSAVKTGDPAIPDIALPDGTTLNIEAAVAPHCYTLVPDVMDAEQMRFMHVPAYRDVATAMHFLGSLTDRTGAGRSWLLRVDQSVVGWVSLFNVEHDMRELGYFVRARDGGRGIATAAARWATRHAHAELGVRRLH
ncbi:MAG: GNAT family N-acetyltransferase, partial [Pseudomonadota bacterium]